MSAGDEGVPEGMSVYNNGMLDYDSELGSPNARHSSSHGATSSGEHGGAGVRVEFTDSVNGQWHHTDRVSSPHLHAVACRNVSKRCSGIGRESS